MLCQICTCAYSCALDPQTSLGLSFFLQDVSGLFKRLAEQAIGGPPYQGLFGNVVAQVVITMSETYWTTAGNRLVNIAVNGLLRNSSIDPFTAGGGGRFLPSTFTYTVQAVASFGGIQVTFTAAADQPSVAAIEVYDLGTNLTAPATNATSPNTSTPTRPGGPGTSWVTHQFDSERTGANPSETLLTPQNVPALKLAGVIPMDGYVYAQPLVLHSRTWRAWDATSALWEGACAATGPQALATKAVHLSAYL